MQCVQYASYNSLGGCSKARSALTTAPSNEKEKTSENTVKQSDNTDDRILKTTLYAVGLLKRKKKEKIMPAYELLGK